MRAEAKNKEYRGYFKQPSGADFLLVTNSHCTKNDFMDEVVQNPDEGGCGAITRDIDIGNVFGDTSCSTDFRSSYITRYGTADDIFEECLCNLLDKVDGACDEQGWIIAGYVVAGLVGCALLGCAGFACYQADIPGKATSCFNSITAKASSCFTSVKNSAASLMDCTKVETADPHVEQGESSQAPRPFIFLPFIIAFLNLKKRKSSKKLHCQKFLRPHEAVARVAGSN